jgi:hypothetical protein
MWKATKHAGCGVAFHNRWIAAASGRANAIGRAWRLSSPTTDLGAAGKTVSV